MRIFLPLLAEHDVAYSETLDAHRRRELRTAAWRHCSFDSMRWDIYVTTIPAPRNTHTDAPSRMIYRIQWHSIIQRDTNEDRRSKIQSLNQDTIVFAVKYRATQSHRKPCNLTSVGPITSSEKARTRARDDLSAKCKESKAADYRSTATMIDKRPHKSYICSI